MRINGRLGTAIAPRHGTNPPGMIRLDSLLLATTHKRASRCPHVQMRRCDAHWKPPRYADERLGSARELAVNARVPSDGPGFAAARPHDEHGRQRRAVRQIVGDSRSAIRCYGE